MFCFDVEYTMAPLSFSSVQNGSLRMELIKYCSIFVSFVVEKTRRMATFTEYRNNAGTVIKINE